MLYSKIKCAQQSLNICVAFIMLKLTKGEMHNIPVSILTAMGIVLCKATITHNHRKLVKSYL